MTGRRWVALALMAAGALTPGPAWTDAHAYVRAGGQHTCAQLTDGRMVCWGSNMFGQLGDGTFTDAAAPTAVTGPGEVVDLSASVDHTCAVTRDGATWCWGANGWGQLGDGQTATRAAPARVLDQNGEPLSGGSEITLGYYHTCGRAGGHVWCAGRNELGQLGRGAFTPDPEPHPVEVQDIDRVVEISAGFDHACALRDDGTVWCWGGNDYGQLGFSTGMLCPLGRRLVPCAPSPGRVSDLTEIVHVSAGAVHTCALRRDGALYCWGDDRSGQLGGVPGIGGPTPVRVLTDATSVRAGGRHSCAIRSNRTVTCWGADDRGQLGNGLIASWSPPMPALIAPDVIEITAGWRHTCARRSDRSVWCWGDNSAHQLGYDTNPLRFSPRPAPSSLTAP